MNNSSVSPLEGANEPCGLSSLDYLNHYFSTIGSIGLNALLLYCIKMRSNGDLNSYTILLKVNCVADCLNGFYNCILFFYEDSTSGLPVYVINGIFKYVVVYFPENFKHWLLSGCMGFLLATVNISAVPFIYRYLLLCRQYTTPRYGLFIIYLVAFIPNIAGIVLYVLLIDRYGYIIVNLVNNQSSICLLGEQWTTSYSGFSITDPFDIFLNRLSSLAIYTCFLSYVAIILCGGAIIRYLQVNHAHLTDPKIQSDISLTLAVQTLIPIIFCSIPIYLGVAYKGPRFKVISFRFIFQIVLWLPFFNPLAAFYFIRPYREFMFDLLRLITHPGGQGNSSVQFLASGQHGLATRTIN